jgi:hypothetical protein
MSIYIAVESFILKMEPRYLGRTVNLPGETHRITWYWDQKSVQYRRVQLSLLLKLTVWPQIASGLEPTL